MLSWGAFLSSPGPFSFSHNYIEYLTLGLLSSHWNIYRSTTAYFFEPPWYVQSTRIDISILYSNQQTINADNQTSILNLELWQSFVFLNEFGQTGIVRQNPFRYWGNIHVVFVHFRNHVLKFKLLYNMLCKLNGLLKFTWNEVTVYLRAANSYLSVHEMTVGDLYSITYNALVYGVLTKLLQDSDTNRIIEPHASTEPT